VLDNIYFHNKNLDYSTTYIVGINLEEGNYILSDLYKVEIFNKSDNPIIYINKVEHLFEDYLREKINLLVYKNLIEIKNEIENFLKLEYIKSTDDNCNIRDVLGTKINMNSIISNHMRIYNYYNKFSCYDKYINKLKEIEYFTNLKANLKNELEGFLSSKDINDYFIPEFMMISNDKTFGIQPVFNLYTIDSVKFNSIDFIKFNIIEKEKIELSMPYPIVFSYGIEKLSSQSEDQKNYLEYKLKSYISKEYFINEKCETFNPFIDNFKK
jgi:hypothetical protein